MRHSAIVCLFSARRQYAVVALLQQIFITQSEDKHTMAYPFNFNMLGVSRMALLRVAAFAKGITISYKPRLAYMEVGT